MDKNILSRLGLTKNQIEIYLALLKLGEASGQQVMKESGLHRSRVYDGLERLQEIGLVSNIIRDFKKYFQAISPEKLIDYVDEQKEALKQIIPELKNMEGIKKEEINASVYKGKEGLKAIHSEMLKEGKDIYVLGAKGLIFTEFPYFIPNFEKEIKTRKIKIFCLWDNEKAKKDNSNFNFIKSRILPKGYESYGVVNIFGNKVATILWKEKYPTGFMIVNKDIADSYRKWFDLIWKCSKN